MSEMCVSSACPGPSVWPPFHVRVTTVAGYWRYRPCFFRGLVQDESIWGTQEGSGEEGSAARGGQGKHDQRTWAWDNTWHRSISI